MRFFARILSVCIDFLFPKSQKIIELENLPSGKILELLPPANLEETDVIALFDYSHPLVREIIWSIKYRGERHLADKIAEILSDTIEHEIAERGLYENFSDEQSGRRAVLVPMPVSDKRRFERGWNQVELVAEAIKKHMGHNIKYLPNQLVKHRHTESQTKTGSKLERQKNLEGSMKILHPSSVENRSIILLDDVTTTGSTFKEARRVLNEAGAKKIICLAIAH